MLASGQDKNPGRFTVACEHKLPRRSQLLNIIRNCVYAANAHKAHAGEVEDQRCRGHLVEREQSGTERFLIGDVDFPGDNESVAGDGSVQPLRLTQAERGNHSFRSVNNRGNGIIVVLRSGTVQVARASMGAGQHADREADAVVQASDRAGFVAFQVVSEVR
jgi:hypothetical protein